MACHQPPPVAGGMFSMQRPMSLLSEAATMLSGQGGVGCGGYAPAAAAAAGPRSPWAPRCLQVLAEERTLRLLIIPFGTVFVTLSMSMMNGCEFAFVSDALNSEKREPLQQVIARYYLWHLTIFSIFSFKLRALPSSLVYVAYLNLFVFLLCLWSGFKTWDGSYWRSWRQYLHWTGSGCVLFLFAFETPLVWWKEKAVGGIFLVLVVGFIAAFLASEFVKLPSSSIPWIEAHWELPLEWLLLGAHFGIVWIRWPLMEREAAAERARLAGAPAPARPLQRSLAFAPGIDEVRPDVRLPKSAQLELRHPGSFLEGSGAAVSSGAGCFWGGCCASAAGGRHAPLPSSEGDLEHYQVTAYQFAEPGDALAARRGVSLPMIFVGLFGTVVVIAILGIAVEVPLRALTATTTTIAASRFILRGSPRPCTLWGSHLQTFDDTFANFPGVGEVYVVKSQDVTIQARYSASPLTNWMPAIEALAVGGPFLEGHRLIVGPVVDGDITWDGEPILQGFPSTFRKRGLATLYYNGQGELVQVADDHVKKRILHMDLPSGVRLEVLRWSHHINVRITMSPTSTGQSGCCGDFGNDPPGKQGGGEGGVALHRVPRDEFLFRTQASPSKHRAWSLEDCAEHRRSSAEEFCLRASNKAPTAASVLQSCIFDVCFGGRRYAAENALLLSGVGVPEG